MFYAGLTAWLYIVVFWKFETSAAERPFVFLMVLLLAVVIVVLVVNDLMHLAWPRRLKVALGPAFAWGAVFVTLAILTLAVLQIVDVLLRMGLDPFGRTRPRTLNAIQ